MHDFIYNMSHISRTSSSRVLRRVFFPPGNAYMIITDNELVHRARSGDREAFGELVERHQKSVAGFLLSIFHDPDAVEDAAQQAFIKAFQSLKSFEGRSNFKTWVSRIAINEARSRLRGAKLRRWLPLDAPQDEGTRTWEERLRHALHLENEEEIVDKKLDLERGMASLSHREREIAALRLEGFALGEIADILQVTEGTVKSTLFTATRKIREKMT